MTSPENLDATSFPGSSLFLPGNEVDLDEVLNGGKPLDVKRVQKKGTNWKNFNL